MRFRLPVYFGSALALVVAWSATAAQAALLYHYTFDGDNLANSGSGSATVTEEGTIAYINGPTGFGRAASFNGTNDFYSGSTAAELDWSAVTISMITRTPSAANFRDWWSLGSVANQQFWESNGASSGTLFRAGNPTSGSFSNANLVGPTSLRGSDWHWVTFTFDQANNQALLYVDGSLFDSDTWNASGAIGAFQVASRLGDSVRRIAADIDDVRIYNEVLSASQVAALVPEPSTFALAALGLAAVRRRRR